MRRALAAAVAALSIGAASLTLAVGPQPSPPPDAVAADDRPHDGSPVAVGRGIVDVDGGIVQLAASRDGVVRSVLVEEGEHVRSGQVLAVLDDRAAALALAVAEAELAEARAGVDPIAIRESAAAREHARLTTLARSDAVSRRALDEAVDALRLARSDLAAQRAAVATAVAREAAARHEMDERTVRAPSDGTIVRRLARPGDGVSTLSVTTLFWLAPDGPPIVRAEIEESFADRVRPGMPAKVVFESDESRDLGARVTRVGRAFGPRRVTVHDPRDRADVRVIEVILALDAPAADLPLGQRMIVRIGGGDDGASGAPPESAAAARAR